ncbi:MAG: hypothetical protein GY820_39030 [Gammaproteobacteria bacterium]|nr:hypothetical protein [Gammaproteobacteria bacterium]
MNNTCFEVHPSQINPVIEDFIEKEKLDQPPKSITDTVAPSMGVSLDEFLSQPCIGEATGKIPFPIISPARWGEVLSDPLEVKLETLRNAWLEFARMHDEVSLKISEFARKLDELENSILKRCQNNHALQNNYKR